MDTLKPAYLHAAVLLYLKEQNAPAEATFELHDTVAGISIENWNAGKVKKPTLKQLVPYCDKAELMAQATAYRDKRAAAYPTIGEQLDAILKGFNQLRLNGTDMPEDLDRILSLWLEVKKKYPKGR